ncbi:MAG TPA: hypothetical protein VIG25_15065 [Pyrinomonadaceae bacterium]|jgi:hypothetical protein
MKTKRTTRSRFLIGVAAVALMIFALGFSTHRTRAAEPAEQIIFSGVGFADEGAWVGPVGFWVWCINEGTGPYAEHHVCQGAMYVYEQGITVHVDGEVTEEQDDTYTMDLHSKRPGIPSATLHNLTEDSGPTNTVEFTITTGQGTASGASTNAVVNVTGPGD